MRLHGSCGSWPNTELGVHRNRLGPTHLLLHLQTVDDGSKLAEDLVGLLVELQLGGDQVGQVAQGLGGIKDLNN